MKKHNGMRPQDIVVLLKIAVKGGPNWLMKDLAHELGISASEVSESLNRSKQAGLISSELILMKRRVIEFLQYGLRYVYPAQVGSIVQGIPTSLSAPPLNKKIKSYEHYVWAYEEGKVRGQSVEPLHPSAAKACLGDIKLYELLALVDAVRMSRDRHVRRLALSELEKRIDNI